MNSYTGVYVRVSTKEQRTDSQVRELKRYCQQRGFKPTEFFVDKISGEKSSRPELNRLTWNWMPNAVMVHSTQNVRLRPWLRMGVPATACSPEQCRRSNLFLEEQSSY